MSYSHSIIKDCECIEFKDRKAPKVLRNYSEDELDVLLTPERLVEYRYYKPCCFGREYVVVVHHCNVCSVEAKYYYSF